jgi:hypothetical protein
LQPVRSRQGGKTDFCWLVLTKGRIGPADAMAAEGRMKKGGKAKADGKQSSSNATAGPEQPLTFNQDRKKEDTPDGVSSAKAYAFEDGIIRLNQRDFDAWSAAYGHLDLRAELLSLSKWASDQGDKWFHALKGALAKRNRDVKAEQERLAKQGGFKWNSGIEGIV